MKIRTQYQTNAAGTGQILAKGGGKQRTLTYDHSLGVRGNHRAAAEAVAHVHGVSIFPGTHTVWLPEGRAEFEVGS